MNQVLITGATSGIGEALVKQYQQANHRVFACGRNIQKLIELEQEKFASTLVFDITQPVEVNKAAEQVDELDILLLNAGDCEYIEDAYQFDSELFSRIINTNLTSIGFVLSAFLPKLKRGGQLVFVSSSVTLLPLPRAEAYGASKAGIDYLANTLRLDLAKKNIGVTLVHPGFIKTPLTDKNTFAMPFIITAEEAAVRIVKGVSAKKSYLQFPKKLTYLLRLIALIPQSWWTFLIRRSKKS